MPELNQLCDRMTRAEVAIDDHKQRMEEFHVSLLANTAMTKEGLDLAKKSIVVNQSTADNTAELVELAKFFKYFQKFVLWSVSICVPIWGLIEFIRHFK
jgi:hypothetical protein